MLLIFFTFLHCPRVLIVGVFPQLSKMSYINKFATGILHQLRTELIKLTISNMNNFKVDNTVSNTTLSEHFTCSLIHNKRENILSYVSFSKRFPNSQTILYLYICLTCNRLWWMKLSRRYFKWSWTFVVSGWWWWTGTHFLIYFLLLFLLFLMLLFCIPQFLRSRKKYTLATLVGKKKT